MAPGVLHPTTWVPYLPWIGVAHIIKDAQAPLFKGPYKSLVAFVSLALYAIASIWQNQVTRIVPEPYLDEIFHIPQAQAYCVGDFHIWDPKLTTPPGLYAFATIFGNLGGIRNCDVFTLRLFNTLVLVLTMSYASSCRGLINRLSNASALKISPDTLHTAFNIALFPPLFFFSGLFYTDVLSTCLVLRMYKLFLQRERGVWLYVAGILALTMRQTNIFWVAVYMGGLEVVRTLQDIQPSPLKETSEPKTWKETVISTFRRYARGEIHDIPLQDAEIHDFALCALSIGIATLSHPLLILSRIWPYIALLLSFGVFVFWNGGVVLGDKSNHVATIHIPQLLYLWPFITFFSFPLLLPSALSLLHFLATPILSLLPRRAQKQNPPSPTSPTFKTLLLLLFLPLPPLLLIIKHNTLIHPFTLADNRHYMFYIFRYTILRHPLIRYLLAPIYILCFYLVYRTTSSSPLPLPQQKQPQKLQPTTPTTTTKTSSALLLLLATTLSLITAPLVEPRYFIIPWVLWRLNLPSPSLRKSKSRASRVLLETLWFLIVNLGTGYVFLYRGFEWEQERGRVQRFMW